MDDRDWLREENERLRKALEDTDDMNSGCLVLSGIWALIMVVLATLDLTGS